MSESLRNDGRVWVPRKPGDKRHANQIPDEGALLLPGGTLNPSFGNLVPRDVASRNAKDVCDKGHGVGPSGLAVYLDFRDSIKRYGRDKISERYGNLFDMYPENYRVTTPTKNPCGSSRRYTIPWADCG